MRKKRICNAEPFARHSAMKIAHVHTENTGLMSAGPFSSYVVRRRRMGSVLRMGKGNFKSNRLATFTVGALLTGSTASPAPFRRWARQAAPLRPIFILRGVAKRHDRLSGANNLRTALGVKSVKHLLLVKNKGRDSPLRSQCRCWLIFSRLLGRAISLVRAPIQIILQD